MCFRRKSRNGSLCRLIQDSLEAIKSRPCLVTDPQGSCAMVFPPLAPIKAPRSALEEPLHLTWADRIIASLAAAYFAYRLWSGLDAGVIDGEGDMDVHADHHPMAFVLTALSMVLLVAILVVIALGPNAVDVQRMIAWLGKA
jgi:hypothetical protein